MPHQRPSRRRARWAWIATALLAVLLCAATLAPAVPSGGPVSNDKAQHFIGFALLAAPLSFAYPRHIWAVILAAIAFGGAIELIQPSVGRGRELGDLVADGLGAVAGAAIARAAGLRGVS